MLPVIFLYGVLAQDMGPLTATERAQSTLQTTRLGLRLLFTTSMCLVYLILGQDVTWMLLDNNVLWAPSN